MFVTQQHATWYYLLLLFLSTSSRDCNKYTFPYVWEDYLLLTVAARTTESSHAVNHLQYCCVAITPAATLPAQPATAPNRV